MFQQSSAKNKNYSLMYVVRLMVNGFSERNPVCDSKSWLSALETENLI